ARDPAELVDAGAREHYDDASLYDYEYRRRRHDVNHYRALVRDLADPDQPILELGCGSGRLTSALCRDGRRVTGFDLSAPMLHQARRRLARLPRGARDRATLFRGDLRRFALGRRFPLVLAAFNVL